MTGEKQEIEKFNQQEKKTRPPTSTLPCYSRLVVLCHVCLWYFWKWIRGGKEKNPFVLVVYCSAIVQVVMLVFFGVCVKWKVISLHVSLYLFRGIRWLKHSFKFHIPLWFLFRSNRTQVFYIYHMYFFYPESLRQEIGKTCIFPLDVYWCVNICEVFYATNV